MKRLSLCLLALLAVGQTAALEKPQFGGYGENVLSAHTDKDHSLTDIATVRLEGSWDYQHKGGIEIHGILSSPLQPLDPFLLMRERSVTRRIIADLETGLQSAISDSLAAFGLMEPVDTAGMTEEEKEALFAGMKRQARLQEDIREAADYLIRFLPYSSFYPKDKLTLDRAVVKFYTPLADFCIGRQMIGWGTGYGWNPTDIWNRKNPADPTAPKLGVNALRAEIPLGTAARISAVVSPGSDIDHTTAGLRVKTFLGGYDLSLSAIRSYTVDAELLGLPQKIMVGGDLAGQIGEVGVWFEGAAVNPKYPSLEWTDFDSLYAQIDAGCDYTFENGLYLMGEYYYNGLGENNPDRYDPTDLVRLLGGEMAGFGRHYAMAGATKDFFTYAMASLFALGNLSDLSFMLLPSVEYEVTANLLVKIGGQIVIGSKRESEFGGLYHSGSLTVQGFF